MTKYASKAAFAKAVALAREHQIEVGGFDLFPDGRIRIITPRLVAAPTDESLFDQLEREGKL